MTADHEAEIRAALLGLERVLRADVMFHWLVGRARECPRCGVPGRGTCRFTRTHRCRDCGHAWPTGS
jgi:hypothetical protein